MLLLFKYWILTALVSDPTQFPKETGLATTFATPGDKWAGKVGFCLRNDKGKPRKVMPDDHIIAHRTLPCGTLVVIRNRRTDLKTLATVGDRGPYGACVHPDFKKGQKRCPKGFWQIKIKPTDPGIWRGVADLTPSVSRAIGHNGFEPIDLFIIKKGKARKQRTRKPNT